MSERTVMAANMYGTYTAGVFCADSDAEAIEQARAAYRDSALGRSLRDAAAFRFYVVRSADAVR